MSKGEVIMKTVKKADSNFIGVFRNSEKGYIGRNPIGGKFVVQDLKRDTGSGVMFVSHLVVKDRISVGSCRKLGKDKNEELLQDYMQNHSEKDTMFLERDGVFLSLTKEDKLFFLSTRKINCVNFFHVYRGIFFYRMESTVVSKGCTSIRQALLLDGWKPVEQKIPHAIGL